MTPAALYVTKPCSIYVAGRYLPATVTGMDGPGRLINVRLATGERLTVPYQHIKARRP